MSSLFLQAAASYFGLADNDIRASQWFTENGATIAVFELRVSDEQMIGVVDRMRALRAQDMAQVELPGMEVTTPTDEELRAAYDQMTQAQKSVYGSFARFKALGGAEHQPEQSEGVAGRQVAHVSVPETKEGIELPAAVWVGAADVRHAQRLAASDYDAERDAYLIQVAMLTADQRAKYGAAS